MKKQTLWKCSLQENQSLKRKLKDVETVMNPDQFQLITENIKKIKRWSDQSITEGLRCKFSCGSTAYETERKKRFLPSGRTLRERLQNIHFESGVLEEAFVLLEHKVPRMKDTDKNWLKARWKQLVAYYYTRDSINNGCLKSILFDVIRKTESTGLRVHAAVSDCGGNNKKLWNDCGIQHARENVLFNKPIEHPCDKSRTLEIMPDSVHVMKSMIQGWVANGTIQIDQITMESNGLHTPTADINPLKELVMFEKGCDLRMTCGLRMEDVDFSKKASNFDKMKVINSTKYANHGVAAALRIFGAETGRKDVLTIAFLIDQIANWFTYMTTRSIQLAFSYRNETAYQKLISFFDSFRSIIFNCKVGAKGWRKPWQSAVVMATDSMIRIQEFLLSHKGFDFFLGGRLTQDCVENVFSQLRSRQMRPNALQIKDSLKLLAVSQYLNDIAETSYEWDNSKWLLEFSKKAGSNRTLGAKRELKDNKIEQSVNVHKKYQCDEDDIIEECDTLCYRSCEQKVVYNVAGMIMHKIPEHSRVCMKCLRSCIPSEFPLDDITTD
ncbi:uncharacterized protein LOC129724430 isoform X2 [Wyeomyia smithii]|uniref:uncharacterized protein LOC129724430 isoform X2 n=1 Tax=Wyeomyia smithii TaxID=174621 RepID=UPI002467B348|nr:uncharacterized protein LOC129724430 isoform X2 [Wyeomyia smithii]